MACSDLPGQPMTDSWAMSGYSIQEEHDSTHKVLSACATPGLKKSVDSRPGPEPSRNASDATVCGATAMSDVAMAARSTVLSPHHAGEAR